MIRHAAIALLSVALPVAAQTTTYRMVALGIDTSADRMALHPPLLPQPMPVLGTLVDGTVTIHGNRLTVTTRSVRGRDTTTNVTHATLEPNQMGSVRHAVIDGKEGGSGLFLHRVGDRFYFLPGQSVRITLARSAR